MSERATSFQAAVCARFGCAPEAYAETVFQHTLFGHARWPSRLLRRLWPKFFADDFILIAGLAKLDSRGAIRRMVNAERYHCPPEGFLRHDLYLRVSGNKLCALANELFPPQPENTGFVRATAADLGPLAGPSPTKLA